MDAGTIVSRVVTEEGAISGECARSQGSLHPWRVAQAGAGNPDLCRGGPGHPGAGTSASALTLSGDTLWAYYYSDYPVVRVDDRQVRAWAPRKPDAPAATGTQALATDGRHVALAGGYTCEEDRVVVLRLEEQWVTERTIRLRLQDGSQVASGAAMQGFADMLHVFAGREWYQI